MTAVLMALVFSAIEVRIERCPGLEASEVQRIVDVELAWSAVTQEPIRARLRCSGTSVEVQVEDPVTRKTLSRQVNLERQAQRGQSRALALAIAELMTASWSELLLAPVPRAEPDVALAPPEVAARAVDALPPLLPRGVLRLEGSGTARVLPASSVVQWGGAARVLWVPHHRWGVLADVALEHGTTSRSEGQLRIDSLSASFSGAVLFAPATWLELHLAAGARFGVGRVIGVPTDVSAVEGASLAGAWGGPLATAGAGVVVGPVLIGAAAELGYAALGLTATVNGASAVGLDALWAGVSVSVGWHR